MPREDDIRRIVSGARAKGLGDDQIRALVARYDERQQPTQLPADATAGMMPQSTMAGDPQPAEPTTGDNIRDVLKWGGNVIAGMTGMGSAGREAVENPAYTLATAVGPPAAGKVFTAAGKGAYKGGVALLPRTLKQQHPNMAQTGFREGISLTRRGAKKAARLTSESRAQADDMLAVAEQGGAAPVQPRRVVQSLRPVRDKMKNQAALGLPDETPALAQRAATFAKRNKGGLPLTKAQTLKREAQDLAETAYKARDRGATINSMEALTNEAQARGLREGIEEIVPTVGPVNARTRSLMGVARGAEHASETGHILSRLGGAAGTGAVLGSVGGLLPAVGGAAAGSMLTTPGGLTALGVGLKGAGHYTPQMLRAALLGLLAQE
ncbi:MAG: hypothetical protein GEV06_19745 [Luteitalea sp.]|nr:hypothetical protein [Luteitalea sp.]